jgi:hypothetical protein
MAMGYDCTGYATPGVNVKIARSTVEAMVGKLDEGQNISYQLKTKFSRY